LAASIDAVKDSDHKALEEALRVDRLRLRGALELYDLCSNFARELNQRLSEPALNLMPPKYSAENYSDNGPSLFQLSLRGRLLQIEFEATEEAFSSEDFRRPYVLRGGIRSFNQQLLERSTVNEHGLFYCTHGADARWHYFDARTYRSGNLNEDFLARELEKIL
jgi:hypothetical protein